MMSGTQRPGACSICPLCRMNSCRPSRVWRSKEAANNEGDEVQGDGRVGLVRQGLLVLDLVVCNGLPAPPSLRTQHPPPHLSFFLSGFLSMRSHIAAASSTASMNGATALPTNSASSRASLSASFGTCLAICGA